MRDSILNLELALFLRGQGYDVVWTQWPDQGPQVPHFWALCRMLGLRVVHTVHNVFPHERSAGDTDRYRRVYRASHALIVHSEAALATLTQEFPETGVKAIVAPIGTYTAYPRCPDAREPVRKRLGVGSDTPLALFFGGIRPYKNLDAVFEALRAQPESRTVVVVAGAESGYPDADPADKLARTRRLVRDMGIEHRVKLLEGPFDTAATSELFEACDSVLLPYVESYGSGLLLLAMTFEKLIIATTVGGMGEYLARYPAAILLEDTGPSSINVALARAATAPRGTTPSWTGGAAADFSWPRIVADLWPVLIRKLEFAE